MHRYKHLQVQKLFEKALREVKTMGATATEKGGLDRTHLPALTALCFNFFCTLGIIFSNKALFSRTTFPVITLGYVALPSDGHSHKLVSALQRVSRYQGLSQDPYLQPKELLRLTAAKPSLENLATTHYGYCCTGI